MEFRQIRYLLEIVRGGGFTRAAETLGIAQPSLSVAVQKLEEELGVTLLNRQERKITLTAEGRAFLERAEQIEELVKGVVHEMEEFRGLERGEVRVGIPGMLGAYHFPSVIADFREKFPNLKISVFSDGANKIQAMVEANQLDVGIVAQSEFPDSLASQLILREEMVACVAKRHRLSGRESLRLEELSHEPLFLFNEEFFQRQYLDEVMGQAGLTTNVVFESNLVPLLKQVVARGGGMTTLLKMAVTEPDLAAIPFDPPLYVDAALVWKRHSYLSKATAAFIEFITGPETLRDRPEA